MAKNRPKSELTFYFRLQDHPNVIKLYEYFEDKKNVYLVTE